MPRAGRIARKFEASVGEGASIHPALHTPQDVGLLRRLAYRLDLHDTVRMWGLELRVPAHRMAPHWLWKVRRQNYERDEASALLTCLERGLPFVEFGGGFGAISCLVNRHALDDPSRHVVVEMDPELVTYLADNRDRNGCRYEVVHAAVSDRPVRLDKRPDFIGQQAATDGEEVPNVTPGDLVRERGWDRVNVFMDIEGMEVDLLETFPDFFRDHVEVLVLETHGHKAPTRAVAQLPVRLQALGLEAVWTRNRVWAYRRAPEAGA